MAASLTEVITAVNTLWVLVTGFLVFFMQLGFGMLEAGLIRVKNVTNILIKNILDFCIASIVYWGVGYALMYGAGNALFGATFFFLRGIPEMTAGVPTLAYWFFQLCFAGAAATIVAGGVAERTKFIAYLFYSVVVSTFIYPIVGHWIWGGGFLANLGMLDYAGSSVVHSVGGWAALMGTLALGPRIGKFNKDGSANAIVGHSLALANVGLWVLWVGWFGFNPGSSLSGMTVGLNASVAVNTNVAAATGAITCVVLSKVMTGKWDLGMTTNGVLAGLVAITAPCAYVSYASSILIAIIGGSLCYFAVGFLDRIHVDDPVGALPVHLVNGMWGTIAVGLFHETKGLFFGGGLSQLGIQTLGVISVALWTTVTAGFTFWAIKHTVGLRVTAKEELEGLDLAEHGSTAYPEFQIVSMAMDGRAFRLAQESSEPSGRS
ncbi:MAG: ammonium transporter [Chloroflexota bacterium]